MRSDSFLAQLRLALARPDTAPVRSPAPVTRNTLVRQVHVALARQSPAFQHPGMEAEQRRAFVWSTSEVGLTNFEEADLTSASFRRADLRGANLTRAVMHSADLRLADLRGANLAGADLTSADLQMADLRGANFEAAILVSANMRGARIGGINLRGAVMTSVDMQGVVTMRGTSKDQGFPLPLPRQERPNQPEEEPELRVPDQESGSPATT
ncbi:pentapeptide repeat-containing protein [Streptomyces sp. NPDC020681]|uniref:pentapeptide repeat-containing protein n=1 Tax=Streptomyces sp. NPDC020681 TaxID=3365083 RepID=UPI0037A34A80